MDYLWILDVVLELAVEGEEAEPGDARGSCTARYGISHKSLHIFCYTCKNIRLLSSMVSDPDAGADSDF